MRTEPRASRRRWPTLAVACLAWGCSGACGGPTVPDARGLNVVLVVMDTLRADHLSVHGAARATSPRLESLAETALLCERAMSQASWTPPSMASMFTGTYETVHQVTQSLRHRSQLSVLQDELFTLPELFRGLGYRTAAVSSQPWIARESGFEQGFDHFDVVSDKNDPLETEKVVRGGLAWVETHRDAPFFLYLHTMNPHDPYDPPPPYDGLWWKEPVPPLFEGVPLTAGVLLQLNDMPTTPSQVDYLRALYDAQISYADAWLGRLVDQLRQWELLDDTLIVVTSDHGESFREHGAFLHGTHSYNTNLHVPLILSNPRLFPRQERLARTVQVIDLFPTLVELFRAEPVPQLQGTSLLSPAHPGIAITEGGHVGYRRKVQDGSWSLITDESFGDVELFDLRADPGETSSVAAAHPEVERRLMDRLVAAHQGSLASPHRVGGAVRTMDAETRERLKALGYVD